MVGNTVFIHSVVIQNKVTYSNVTCFLVGKLLSNWLTVTMKQAWNCSCFCICRGVQQRVPAHGCVCWGHRQTVW